MWLARCIILGYGGAIERFSITNKTQRKVRVYLVCPKEPQGVIILASLTDEYKYFVFVLSVNSIYKDLTG